MCSNGQIQGARVNIDDYRGMAYFYNGGQLIGYFEPNDSCATVKECTMISVREDFVDESEE